MLLWRVLGRCTGAEMLLLLLLLGETRVELVLLRSLSLWLSLWDGTGGNRADLVVLLSGCTRVELVLLRLTGQSLWVGWSATGWKSLWLLLSSVREDTSWLCVASLLGG